jgi:hypothetical protein
MIAVMDKNSKNIDLMKMKEGKEAMVMIMGNRRNFFISNQNYIDSVS